MIGNRERTMEAEKMEMESSPREYRNASNIKKKKRKYEKKRARRKEVKEIIIIIIIIVIESVIYVCLKGFCCIFGQFFIERCWSPNDARKELKRPRKYPRITQQT